MPIITCICIMKWPLNKTWHRISWNYFSRCSELKESISWKLYLFSPQWFSQICFLVFFVLSQFVWFRKSILLSLWIIIIKKWGSARINKLVITFTFHYTFRTLALRPNEYHPIPRPIIHGSQIELCWFRWDWINMGELFLGKFFIRCLYNISLLLSRLFVYSLNVTSLFIFTVLLLVQYNTK